MIKQQIYLDGKEFLCIYHDGFTDYPKNRELIQTESLEGTKIEFHESWIDNLKDELITFDNVFTGFLQLNDDKNPYNSFCCQFEEFIIYEKPLIKNEVIENLNFFKEITNFIKKWTGLDLYKVPYLMNNIIIFKPTKLQLKMRMDDQNNRKLKIKLLENGYEELIGVIKFKNFDIVVDTKIVKIVDSTFYVESSLEWKAVDIELFKQEELVFATYNSSFIQSVSIDMQFTTNRVIDNLHQSKRTVSFEEYSSQPIDIGETTNDSNELITYQIQEKRLKNHLNSKMTFNFLLKGEYEKGLDIFSEIAKERDYVELWIFDPYFLSYESGGKNRINDIIKILGSNLNLKKKIVFEAKHDDTQQKFNDFKAAINTTVSNLKRKGALLDFDFIGTNEHFHDRFIFLKNDYKLRSFMLGTSFNSFGENYSAIIELEELNGKYVFESLKNNILRKDKLILNENIQ